MLQEIKNYLDENDMNYQLISKDGHRIFKMQFGGRNGTMNCIIDVKQDVVLVMAVCNVNTPPNKRLSMSELITRINSKMLLGNFDMDFEDGEVRYNLSWHYDSSLPVSSSVIERNIMTCVAMLDKHYPAIMNVNYTNKTPVLALQEVDGIDVASLN